MTPSNVQLFFLHAFAIAGLVGFTTVPVRLWQGVARGGLRHLALLSRGFAAGAAGIGALLAAGAWLWFDTFWGHLRPCLMDEACGPHQAEGMLALAVFGAYVAVLEAALLGAKFAADGRRPK
jgi:hypothetical protein